MARSKKTPPRSPVQAAQSELAGTTPADEKREAVITAWGGTTVYELFSEFVDNPAEWESLKTLIGALDETLTDRVAAFAKTFGFVPKGQQATAVKGGSAKLPASGRKVVQADAPEDSEKRRGEILKALKPGPLSKSGLKTATGWDVSNVLDAMKADGTLTGAGGRGAGKLWEPA